MRRRRVHPVMLVAVALAAAIVAYLNKGDGVGAVRTAGPPPVSPSSKGAPEARTAPESPSPIPAAERPAMEATLALIERGGPFPYEKDGAVFANREGRLPPQRRGYYREYTVPTPGARSRGARRIVRGEGGETYYTNDHYKTFVRIDE